MPRNIVRAQSPSFSRVMQGGRSPSFAVFKLDMYRSDFAKYVSPTVKSDRNVIGPIKPTFFSDQMSAIVQDRISVFTDVLSRFPRFSFVAWFPVKVKILIPRLNYFEGAISWKKRTVGTSNGQSVSGIKSMRQIEANRVERTLIEKWKTRQLWLLVNAL